MPDRIDDPTAEDTARTRLQGALDDGVRVTPFCRAVMGWLCEAPTEPSVSEIRVSGEGRVWLRLSDEAYPEPAGTFLEFLEQIRVLCQGLGMSEEQTRQVVGWARARLVGGTRG